MSRNVAPTTHFAATSVTLLPGSEPSVSVSTLLLAPKGAFHLTDAFIINRMTLKNENALNWSMIYKAD